MEKRIADLEKRVAKLEAAAGTAAIIDEELRFLEIRKARIERRMADSIERQRILAALESQRCSLQSSLQKLE